MTYDHCSHGPVSSMPGSAQPLLPGTDKVCDTHTNVPAAFRVQGETDSMGCEYLFMCGACYGKYTSELAALSAEPKVCDLCSTLTEGVKPWRDYDEGSSGPVYQACASCRAKASAYSDRLHDDPDSTGDAFEDDTYEDDDHFDLEKHVDQEDFIERDNPQA